MVVHLRNFLYDIGLFKSKSFATPTICIGNLSLGGTGKTPMAEYLIEGLRREYTVAFLSRGFRRKSKGFILASSVSTVEELGDEPFQVHTKFPNIPVAVDSDRSHGISLLEKKFRPGIIILDDAFQHRRVKPDYSILLTTYGKLYSNDLYFPSGSLRDGKKEAKRADVIVVTKCPPKLPEQEQSDIFKKLSPEKGKKVLFSYLEYAPTIKGLDNEHTLESLKNMEVTLVTGIADPEPLRNYLTARGIFFDHIRFKDHHFFTPSELQLLNTKNYVLTTEKDYTRLSGKVKNLNYIAIRHVFLNDGEAFLFKAIKETMKQRP